MEVATLMTRMHENLSEIHKTIAGLSIETHDSKIDELEEKRDSILESLQAKFERDQEEASIKREAEIQQVLERRKKEDEEREARRKQEDEERDTSNRAEDEQKRNLLHTEMRNVEDETEEQLDDIEAEARRLIEEGRGKIHILEEKRREINQLIDEQLKLPLPDVPIRKRDRATRKLTSVPSPMPAPISAQHGEERSEDKNIREEAPTKDPNTDYERPEMGTEIRQAETGESHLSDVTSDSQQPQSIDERTDTSLFPQSEGDRLSSHEAFSRETSLLVDDEMESSRGEYTSSTLDQELAHTAEPEDPSVLEHYREVEPTSGPALIETSTKVELDSPPAGPGKTDDHLASSRSGPSSPVEAYDVEEANTNTPKEERGEYPHSGSGASVSEDHSRTLPEDTAHLLEEQGTDALDDRRSSSHHYHEAESPESQAHSLSDRSEPSQDGVDVLVPNEQRSRLDQTEQSNSPNPVEENQPFTVLGSPLTSPTATQKPESRTSIGADRDDTTESIVWGLESLPHSTSHVTGGEDGGSVAAQASRDDHESEVSRELSAATPLEHLASPTQEDPYPGHTINSDSLPRESNSSPPTDQHHTLESNSPTNHNVLSSTHSPRIDVFDVELDEQPEITQSAEESQADSYGPDQPAGDVYGATAQPDPELDSNNLESPSSLGQIRDLPAEEYTNAHVKEDNVHSSDQGESETPHSTLVGPEAVTLNDDTDESANELSKEEAIEHHEELRGQSDATSPTINSFVGEQDLPKFEGRGLEGNNYNNNDNDDNQSFFPEMDSHVKLHEAPMLPPLIEGNNQAHHSPTHSAYEDPAPITNEAHLSSIFEEPGDERLHIQQELGQNNNIVSDTNVESYDSTTGEGITNTPGMEPDEYVRDGLHVDSPPRQASRSPLPVENDTMQGHDDLFDDDAVSSNSYEDEEPGPGSANDQAFDNRIEYVASELPDTPRTTIPPSDQHHQEEEAQDTVTKYASNEVHAEGSTELQNSQEEVLSSVEEKTRHGDALEAQYEAEPTPTATIFQRDQTHGEYTYQSPNDPLAPSKGLAASRHAPESQLQTPPQDQSRQADEDFDSQAFAPRDVTNLPWHERTDSTTLSMRSESTLSSAPSSPVHSSPPSHYQEPMIRESWSTHSESRGRLRNDSQLTDQSANDEFDPFRIEADKPPAVPSSVDLDAQRLQSNRNSLGGSPMFQKLRGLFESQNTAASDQASSSSSLASSRPTSAIYTGAAAAAARPQSPAGRYANDDEDEDGAGEHTALLRDQAVSARET